MIRRSLTLSLLFAAALPVLACAAPAPAAPAAAEAYQRIELKGPNGKALPYTIEIPKDWQVRSEQGLPGLWLGPADAKPPQDPRLIYVRGSQVSLADPEAVAANIRANDEKEAKWTAPRVEVRDLGGVRGILVQMDTDEGAGEGTARSTLTLKLPLEPMAVDFVASASRSEFAKLLPVYERILLSVRPAK
jgi:hypothetical protein